MFYEEADDTRTFGRFYLVMVKSVLLFGSEFWVINTPCILRDLSIFQIGWSNGLLSVCFGVGMENGSILRLMRR